jgi:hypothetical protein
MNQLDMLKQSVTWNIERNMDYATNTLSEDIRGLTRYRARPNF